MWADCSISLNIADNVPLISRSCAIICFGCGLSTCLRKRLVMFPSPSLLGVWHSFMCTAGWLIVNVRTGVRLKVSEHGWGQQLVQVRI